MLETAFNLGHLGGTLSPHYQVHGDLLIFMIIRLQAYGDLMVCDNLENVMFGASKDFLV